MNTEIVEIICGFLGSCFAIYIMYKVNDEKR